MWLIKRLILKEKILCRSLKQIMNQNYWISNNSNMINYIKWLILKERIILHHEFEASPVLPFFSLSLSLEISPHFGMHYCAPLANKLGVETRISTTLVDSVGARVITFAKPRRSSPSNLQFRGSEPGWCVHQHDRVRSLVWRGNFEWLLEPPVYWKYRDSNSGIFRMDGLDRKILPRKRREI